MTIKGKGINLQILAECFCYLLFGGLLFDLTYSGRYLDYVTPRMKPYLYGLSMLMFLWTAAAGRYIFTPQHRVKLARTFVFIIPILLLAVRPAVPDGSSMVRNYSNSSTSMAAGNSSSQNQGDSQVPISEEETDEYTEETSDQPAVNETPKYTLNGLDEESKTITIADKDYYAWMYELSSFYKKYKGYTVVVKGFIYRDSEVAKQGDFALVRLSMWCCAADLSPLGFLVNNAGTMDFKDNDWVVVTGKLGISEDGNSIMIKAHNIVAAVKPEEEYVYPYF